MRDGQRVAVCRVGVGKVRMQLECTGRGESTGMGVDLTCLEGGRQVVDQEPGLGHAPVQNFRDSDHFQCNLVFQPWIGWSEENPHSTRSLGLQCSLAPQMSDMGLAWSNRLWMGGGISRGIKDCPTLAPMLGEEANAARGRSSPVMGSVFTSPHNLSVRWKSILPFYR